MAVGFRGSRSSGGSSGAFDESYFDVPSFTRGEILESSSNSNPTGGDSNNTFVDYSAGIPTYPAMTGPADYALYQGMDPALGNFSGESGQVPNYFTTDSLTDQDIENYLNDIENFVFNPGTGEYEPAGKYSYPLSQLAPEYSDNIDTFLLGVKPGMSGDALQRIEANRLNVQQDALKNHMEMVQQITGDPIRRAEEESRNPGDLDTVAEVQAFERQMADAIDAAGRGGTNPFRNPTSGGGGGGGGVFGDGYTFCCNEGGRVPASSGGK